MAKWILSAESYGAFRHTTEYIPRSEFVRGNSDYGAPGNQAD